MEESLLGEVGGVITANGSDEESSSSTGPKQETEIRVERAIDIDN